MKLILENTERRERDEEKKTFMMKSEKKHLKFKENKYQKKTFLGCWM